MRARLQPYATSQVWQMGDGQVIAAPWDTVAVPATAALPLPAAVGGAAPPRRAAAAPAGPPAPPAPLGPPARFVVTLEGLPSSQMLVRPGARRRV